MEMDAINKYDQAVNVRMLYHYILGLQVPTAIYDLCVSISN